MRVHDECTVVVVDKKRPTTQSIWRGSKKSSDAGTSPGRHGDSVGAPGLSRCRTNAYTETRNDEKSSAFARYGGLSRATIHRLVTNLRPPRGDYSCPPVPPARPDPRDRISRRRGGTNHGS